MSATSRLSCDICGKVFKHAYSVTVHKRVHTGERPYKCGQCERAFIYNYSCKIHMFTAHGVGNINARSAAKPTNQIYTCKYCKQTFLYLSKYSYHMFSIHGERQDHMIAGKSGNQNRPRKQTDTNTERRKLRLDESSTSKNQLPTETPASNLRQSSNSRNSNTSKQRKYAGLGCHICQRTFVNNSALNSHMRLHDRPLTSNSHSDASGTTGNNNLPNKRRKMSDIASTGIKHLDNKVGQNIKFRESEQVVTNAGQNIRNTDDSMTNSVKKQSRSKINDVTVSNTGSRASISDVFAPGESSLEQKLNGKKFCKCPRCGEAYINKDLLAAHTCRFKMKGTFRCPKCNKFFKTSIRLRQHISMIHPKSKYTCTTCCKSFETMLDYNNHTKAHDTGEERKEVYECSVCKEKLYTSNSFIKHQRLHNKFYQCRVCRKCFATKEEQTRHSKHSHVRELLYTCLYCERKFATKDSRSKHIRRIHQSQTPRRNKPISARKPAPVPYMCSQCNTPFTKEYLLRKHVMKVHWKEDNKINQMKQFAVKRMKQNSAQTLEKQPDDQGKHLAVKKTKENTQCADNEVKRYTCDTCGEHFTTQNTLKMHVNNKHLDGMLHAEGKGDILHLSDRHTSTHSTQTQTFETVSADTNVPRIVAKKKTLNEEILSRYFISTQLLEPCQVIPNSKQKIYICEVCSTSYTLKVNLIRHIKKRAYDHGFYLIKKRQEKELFPLTAVKNAAQNEIIDHTFQDFKQPTQPVKLRPRAECDVCGNIYTRRYNMLLHRQKHTTQEFKDAGAREDVYKSPDGKTVITDLEMNYNFAFNSEHEVSSSTSERENENQTNKKCTNEVTVYLDRADDEEFDVTSEEQLYTAYPYFADNSNDAVLEQHNSMANHADDTSNNIHHINKDIEDANLQFDDQNAERNVIVTSADITEQIQTEEEINGSGQNHSDMSMNTTELFSSSYTYENTTTVEPANEHVTANERPAMSENCNDTVGTVLGSLPQSTVGDERVCLECRQKLFDGQKTMRCRLCDQVFCLYCSGLPADVYDILYSKGTECGFGVWWTCNVCKHLVPKFSVLLQQLGNFEEAINNRLTDLEQRFSMLRPNGKN